MSTLKYSVKMPKRLQMGALKQERNDIIKDTSFLITHLLGVLSPWEIAGLTIYDENIVKESTTSLLEQDLARVAKKSDQAKILPFKNLRLEDENSDQDYIDHLKDSDFSGREEVIIEEGDADDPLSLFKSKTVIIEKKMDTTTFIIREKRKLLASQKKLKEREILGIYKKNAALDIEEEKKLKEDLSQSSKQGVLVNKRQF